MVDVGLLDELMWVWGCRWYFEVVMDMEVRILDWYLVGRGELIKYWFLIGVG